MLPSPSEQPSGSHLPFCLPQSGGLGRGLSDSVVLSSSSSPSSSPSFSFFLSGFFLSTSDRSSRWAAMERMPIPLHQSHASTSPESTFMAFPLFSPFSCLFLLSLLMSPASSSHHHSFIGMSTEDVRNKRADLYPEILRDEAVERLHYLGKISDGEGYLERTFMSPASVKAAILISEWMEDAGLRTWIDCMGNVHGRVEGGNSSAEALLIGSHMDTVVDGGIFDGSLGIISALAALKVLKTTSKLENTRRPIELIAFSDEEGVRFQSTFLGSAAIAGVLPASALQISDKSGMTVRNVLETNSIQISERHLQQLKYDPKSVWGYVEIHIEQGPVLEWVGFPLGVVKGIAGQTRLKVRVRGSQGHAGTVPMSLRRDPLAAAAELIVLLESVCKDPAKFLSFDSHCNDSTLEALSSSLVCTVGEISTWPSASNVIPGQVTFTVDLRAIDDIGREAVIYELSNRMYQICDTRQVSCLVERKHDANAVICDSELTSELKSASLAALTQLVGEIDEDIPALMSGAGHDAMAMSRLTKVGMLFVRCRGGVSHSPDENVLEDDVWAAGLAILAFLDSQI